MTRSVRTSGVPEERYSACLAASRRLLEELERHFDPLEVRAVLKVAGSLAMTEEDAETLASVKDEDTFTSRVVAARLGVAVTAVNNRLARLREAKRVERVGKSGRDILWRRARGGAVAPQGGENG